ncbi:hypothetical protein BS78_02G029900 [Paspalum vaginatum]|nr:hypothetical protein BS78_02G029900 [Paspalum vaginatum]
MAGGDEWIYVSSCQEAAEEKEPTKNSHLDGAAAAASAEESNGGGSHSPPGPGTPEAGALSSLSSSDGDEAEPAAAADSGEEEESCSDDGSGSTTYGSTEVNDYLSGIEGTDDQDEGAADDAAAALGAMEFDLDLQGLLNLKIGDDSEAPNAAAPAASADRGKAAVAENPCCYDYDGDETCGPAYLGSDSGGSGFFGSYDRYGVGYGYGYYNNRYGYGDAYYGSESGYDDAYGYGYGGYYGDQYHPYAPAPRYPPPLVVHRPPPMYNPPAAQYLYNPPAAPPPPYMYYQYAAPVPASRYGPAHALMFGLQPEPRR